jgi:hypothetical protein
VSEGPACASPRSRFWQSLYLLTVACFLCCAQRCKLGRAILVTTDFCEEAESNGDYIAIISERTIPYCMPPSDLLFYLCGGYTINLQLAPGVTCDDVCTFVKRIAPSVRWARMHGSAAVLFAPGVVFAPSPMRLGVCVCLPLVAGMLGGRPQSPHALHGTGGPRHRHSRA